MYIHSIDARYVEGGLDYAETQEDARLSREEERLLKKLETYVATDEGHMAKVKAILQADEEEQTNRDATRPITLRVSESDLVALKKQAEEEGLPYQTHIKRVLHKFTTGQLVEHHER